MTHFLTNWMCQDGEEGGRIQQANAGEWMNDALMAMECFTFRMPITPTVLTDEELRSLRIPVLFLVGEHEVVYPADKAVHRIETVAPWIVTEVIPDASHALTIPQTRIVNTEATTFLLRTKAEMSSGR